MLAVLGPGHYFGDVALKNGTKRSASIVSEGEACLIKIDKTDFDNFVKEDLANNLQDQIEFMMLCPVFHEIDKETLVDLAIRNEDPKFTTGQDIFADNKYGLIDHVFIIRRGSVKVVKEIKFCKKERMNVGVTNAVKWVKTVDKSQNMSKRWRSHSKSKETSEKVKYFMKPVKITNETRETMQEKHIARLSEGPTEEEVEKGEFTTRRVVIETLKLGDIFPTYYAFGSNVLDVSFIADSPCEFIRLKTSDMEDYAAKAQEFIKKYMKPYPNDRFLRKFYYYNTIWHDYRRVVRHNIKTDVYNKEILRKKDMRHGLKHKKDDREVQLPSIFSTRKIEY